MPKLAKTDRLTPGDHLMIPPVPGIVVQVKAGDTPTSIAKAYRVTAQAVSDFNALRDPNSLMPGQLVIVPNGVA